MLLFDRASVRLKQKALIEANKYLVWVQYSETDGNNTKTHVEIRTVSATKKGIVTVSLFGDKYKFDINNVKSWGGK